MGIGKWWDYFGVGFWGIVEMLVIGLDRSCTRLFISTVVV